MVYMEEIMRRLGFVFAVCALVSVSGAALAQAPGTNPAPQANAPAKAKVKAKPVKRIARAGTSTAGAHGFLPLPLGAFAAFAGWGAAATVVATRNVTPVSPQ
jgi:hypothetical protein